MKSNKNFIVTLILAMFGGIFGLHRFYVGKIFTGIFMLFTHGGFGILYCWDLICILNGRFKDSNGNVITNKEIYDIDNKKSKYNITIVKNKDINDNAIVKNEDPNNHVNVIVKNEDLDSYSSPIVEDEDLDNYFEKGGAIKYK